MDMPLEKNHSILGPLTLCHTHPGGFNTAAVIRSRKAAVVLKLFSVVLCHDKYILIIMVGIMEQHVQYVLRNIKI